MASNFGFGVCGSVFGVWCLGFGVWGLGFGVWGLGFGIWDLGFGVYRMTTTEAGDPYSLTLKRTSITLSTCSRFQDFGCMVWGVGLRVWGLEFRVSGFGSRVWFLVGSVLISLAISVSWWRRSHRYLCGVSLVDLGFRIWGWGFGILGVLGILGFLGVLGDRGILGFLGILGDLCGVGLVDFGGVPLDLFLRQVRVQLRVHLKGVQFWHKSREAAHFLSKNTSFRVSNMYHVHFSRDKYTWSVFILFHLISFSERSALSSAFICQEASGVRRLLAQKCTVSRQQYLSRPFACISLETNTLSVFSSPKRSSSGKVRRQVFRLISFSDRSAFSSAFICQEASCSFLA